MRDANITTNVQQLENVDQLERDLFGPALIVAVAGICFVVLLLIAWAMVLRGITTGAIK